MKLNPHKKGSGQNEVLGCLAERTFMDVFLFSIFIKQWHCSLQRDEQKFIFFWEYYIETIYTGHFDQHSDPAKTSWESLALQVQFSRSTTFHIGSVICAEREVTYKMYAHSCINASAVPRCLQDTLIGSDMMYWTAASPTLDSKQHYSAY